MSSKIVVFTLATIVILIIGCKKVPDVMILQDPEKYELKISGDLNYEYSYDESKYVGVSGSGNNDDDFDTYLDLVPGGKSSNTMTIYLYPPPRHEREGDVIGITIKSEKYDPWTFDGSYSTIYINQIPYTSQYAEVNYWDGTDEIDYLSKYRFENTSNKVILKREGKLLFGTITGLKLVNFNSTKTLTINDLRFQVRPSDNTLID